jgi:hypothetical protein
MSGHALTTRERNWLGDQGQAQIESKLDALVAEIQRLRDALELVAEKPFTAALDAREMQEIARAALAGTPSEDT